jgi:hypothetical protein
MAKKGAGDGEGGAADFHIAHIGCVFLALCCPAHGSPERPTHMRRFPTKKKRKSAFAANANVVFASSGVRKLFAIPP